MNKRDIHNIGTMNRLRNLTGADVFDYVILQDMVNCDEDILEEQYVTYCNKKLEMYKELWYFITGAFSRWPPEEPQHQMDRREREYFMLIEDQWNFVRKNTNYNDLTRGMLHMKARKIFKEMFNNDPRYWKNPRETTNVARIKAAENKYKQQLAYFMLLYNAWKQQYAPQSDYDSDLNF